MADTLLGQDGSLPASGGTAVEQAAKPCPFASNFVCSKLSPMYLSFPNWASPSRTGQCPHGFLLSLVPFSQSVTRDKTRASWSPSFLSSPSQELVRALQCAPSVCEPTSSCARSSANHFGPGYCWGLLMGAPRASHVPLRSTLSAVARGVYPGQI